MRIACLIAASLALVAVFDGRNADANESKAIPAECPVTLPSAQQLTPDASEFIHGANSLHVWLPADGIWPGSPHTLRWYYKGASRSTSNPTPLELTAERMDNNGGPPARISRPDTVMRDDYAAAMLTKIEFPNSGCWRVSGRYRADSVSFVVWVE
jgi:hypothetical protein